jgi:ammonia channel protein AmtB
MASDVLLNNLWVLLAALPVFAMTAAVGLLEIGELGEGLTRSLSKTLRISGTAIVVMAIVGFNLGFAATWDGIIGNPLYSNGLLLGGGSAAVHQLGLEALGIVAVMATVFAMSYATMWAIGRLSGGVTVPANDDAATANPPEPAAAL